MDELSQVARVELMASRIESQRVLQYLVASGKLIAKPTTYGQEYYLPQQLKVRGVLVSKLQEDINATQRIA